MAMTADRAALCRWRCRMPCAVASWARTHAAAISGSSRGALAKRHAVERQDNRSRLKKTAWTFTRRPRHCGDNRP